MIVQEAGMSRTRRRWRRGALALIALASAPAALEARDARVIPLAAISTNVEPSSAPAPKPAGFEARKPVPETARSELTVLVDRAKVIRLPEKAQTVIIGNPGVADIAIQKNGIVVLTGKSFGVTNFIAVDSAGNQIAESKVSVVAPTDSTVVVQRGLERQTYSCTPTCQPTVALGDSPAYFGEIRGQADAHGSFIGQR